MVHDNHNEVKVEAIFHQFNIYDLLYTLGVCLMNCRGSDTYGLAIDKFWLKWEVKKERERKDGRFLFVRLPKMCNYSF